MPVVALGRAPSGCGGTSSAETRTMVTVKLVFPEFPEQSATTGDGEARPPEVAKVQCHDR